MGSSGDPRKEFTAARVIDAGGRDVVPGLIDAHGHVMNLGFALLRANLVGRQGQSRT